MFKFLFQFLLKVTELLTFVIKSFNKKLKEILTNQYTYFFNALNKKNFPELLHWAHSSTTILWWRNIWAFFFEAEYFLHLKLCFFTNSCLNLWCFNDISLVSLFLNMIMCLFVAVSFSASIFTTFAVPKYFRCMNISTFLL